MGISILPQPGTTMLLKVKTRTDTGQEDQEPEQSCWEGGLAWEGISTRLGK